MEAHASPTRKSPDASSRPSLRCTTFSSHPASSPPDITASSTDAPSSAQRHAPVLGALSAFIALLTGVAVPKFDTQIVRFSPGPAATADWISPWLHATPIAAWPSCRRVTRNCWLNALARSTPYWLSQFLQSNWLYWPRDPEPREKHGVKAKRTGSKAV